MSRATPLDDLADSTDMVFMHSNHNSNTVQAPKLTESQPANEIKAMKEMMADLQKQLEEMKVTKKQRLKSRTPSRQRRPRSPVDAGMTTRIFADITKRMVTKQRNANPTANLHRPRKTRKPEGNDDEYKKMSFLYLGLEEWIKIPSRYWCGYWLWTDGRNSFLSAWVWVPVRGSLCLFWRDFPRDWKRTMEGKNRREQELWPVDSEVGLANLRGWVTVPGGCMGISLEYTPALAHRCTESYAKCHKLLPSCAWS